MSENINPQNSSEEVDLGQLFKLIGDAFGKLFKFIGSLFTGLFNALIFILLFFRKNFKWFLGALIIGGAIGTTLDIMADKVYAGNLYVKPNFNSTLQLYQNIRYYNALVDGKDTLELAKTFGISNSEASSLKGFFIQPKSTENDIRELYSNFISELDTASLSGITYIDYKESLDIYSLPVHDIGVASKESRIFKKIQPIIIGNILNNDYFKAKRVTELENLKFKEISLNASLSTLDSLRNAYLDIRIRESTKVPVPGSGTNVFMASSNNGLLVDESSLIEKKSEVLEKLNKVKIELTENQKIINIISDFPEVGYETKIFFESRKFVFAFAFFSLVLIFILSKNLNKYLKEKEGN